MFTCLHEAPVSEKKLPSKIITGNNQDSIAVYTDASVTQKVCSHILTSIAKKDKLMINFWFSSDILLPKMRFLHQAPMD